MHQHPQRGKHFQMRLPHYTLLDNDYTVQIVSAQQEQAVYQVFPGHVREPFSHTGVSKCLWHLTMKSTFTWPKVSTNSSSGDWSPAQRHYHVPSCILTYIGAPGPPHKPTTEGLISDKARDGLIFNVISPFS